HCVTPILWRLGKWGGDLVWPLHAKLSKPTAGAFEYPYLAAGVTNFPLPCLPRSRRSLPPHSQFLKSRSTAAHHYTEQISACSCVANIATSRGKVTLAGLALIPALAEVLSSKAPP